MTTMHQVGHGQKLLLTRVVKTKERHFIPWCPEFESWIHYLFPLAEAYFQLVWTFSPRVSGFLKLPISLSLKIQFLSSHLPDFRKWVPCEVWLPLTSAILDSLHSLSSILQNFSGNPWPLSLSEKFQRFFTVSTCFWSSRRPISHHNINLSFFLAISSHSRYSL